MSERILRFQIDLKSKWGIAANVRISYIRCDLKSHQLNPVKNDRVESIKTVDRQMWFKIAPVEHAQKWAGWGLKVAICYLWSFVISNHITLKGHSSFGQKYRRVGLVHTLKTHKYIICFCLYLTCRSERRLTFQPSLGNTFAKCNAF